MVTATLDWHGFQWGVINSKLTLLYWENHVNHTHHIVSVHLRAVVIAEKLSKAKIDMTQGALNFHVFQRAYLHNISLKILIPLIMARMLLTIQWIVSGLNYFCFRWHCCCNPAESRNLGCFAGLLPLISTLWL